MTASYGRPQPRRVNALYDPVQADPLKPMDRQIVPKQNIGRLLDFSSAEVSAANAQRGYNEVASFLEQTIEVAKPIYEEYVNNEVKGQLAQIAEDPEFIERIRAGDEQTRATLRSMRLQTQVIVNENAAAASVAEYAKRYQSQSILDPVLTDSEATVEEKATRRAELRGTLQAELLDPLDARALAGQLDNVALANAGARAATEELAVKEQDRAAQQTLQLGVGANFYELSQLELGYTVSPDGEKTEATDAQVNAAMRDRAFTYLDSIQQDFTPTEIGTAYFRGIQGKALQLAADGRWDEALDILATAQEVAGSYKFDNGLNIGGIAVTKEGGTVSTGLAKLRISLEKKAEEAADKVRLGNLDDQIRTLATADPDSAEYADAQSKIALQTAGDPELYLKALKLGGNIRTQLQKTELPATPAQQQNYLDLIWRVKDPATSWQQSKNLIDGSDLTMDQRIKLASAALEGASTAETTTIQAANNSTDIIDGEAALLAEQAQAAAAALPGTAIALPTAEDLKRDYEIALRNKVTKRLQDEARPVSEGGLGIAPSTARALEVLQEEASIVRQNLAKTLNLPTDLTPKTRQQYAVDAVTKDFEYVRNQLANGADRYSTAIFPPAFVAAIKKATGRDDYQTVLREFIKRMTRIKTDDGKPLFQNPSQSWRDLTGELPDQEPGDAANSMMQGMYGVPASAQKKEGGDEQAANPQEMLQVALGNLFNVVTGTQAASAQYLDGKKDSDYVGMENAEMLSAALRRKGSVDLSPAVGPMPQLGAAAETRAPVPLAIGPNNPYFVAIGLNEGTRTANGGYTRAWSGHTDPGDGAANRGTISARSGSPQSADRYWSGLLTGEAMEARGALLAAGLRDNTVGFQRVMFNVLDLAVQAPGAVPDFIRKLPNMQAADFTIESVAKARADSYINPSTGRLEASGFGNSYNRLFQDQRSRAGTFDYKKRI